MNFIKTITTSAIISLAVLTMSHTVRSEAPAAQPAPELVPTQAPQQEIPFQIVPIWFHVHTKKTGDDGGESTKNVVAYLKSNGYKGVVLTPHSHSLSFPDYKADADGYNTADFIVVAGREISLDSERGNNVREMCHLNAISDSENPPMLARKYNWKQLTDIISQLDLENAVYVWNHPWGCPQWAPSAGLFKGIELFNDFGPGYQVGETYDFNKKAYLGALKSGSKIFAISGIDMHVLAQAKIGEYTTYVFPDEFNRDSLVAAIRNGSTIAAFNSMLYSLNVRPSLKPLTAAGNEFGIKGKVGLKKYNSFKPSLFVYKDGVEYSPSSPAIFVRGEKTPKGYLSYEFSFGDKLAPGTSACYVFEIPHYMFSSPFCFTAEIN